MIECPQCGYREIHAVRARGGKAPYGFRKVDGELVFDDLDSSRQATGPILARMMMWNLHAGTRFIAATLVAQGIEGPGGGEWSHGSVARVIKRGKELTHLIPLEYVL